MIISLNAQKAPPQAESVLDTPSPERIQDIVRSFAAKEREFKQALELYNYQQTVKIQTLVGKHVDGEYLTVSDITIGRGNKRIETLVHAPPSTLQRIRLSRQDLEDISNIRPFILTTQDLPKYDIRYLGHEKIDEITTYAFYVSPRKMIGDERYFEGQIWIDDRDLQIVKTRGRPVFIPTKETRDQRFANFETYRENIDGKYWFPTYTIADDVLTFPDGEQVHVREVILYKNYRQFRSDVKITYGEPVPDKEKKNPPNLEKK